MSSVHSIESANNDHEFSREIAERFTAHPLALLETYKFFNQTSEAKISQQTFIDAVISGKDMPAPVFEYADIKEDELLRHRDTLTELLSEFPIHRQLTPLERITRENIINRLDEISIMLLTKIQCAMSPFDPDYERVSGQLGINMREVYGQPDKDHFRGILGCRIKIISDIISTKTDMPEVVDEAWRFIQARLPRNLPIEQPYIMSPETQAWYAARLAERMKPAREAVELAIKSGEVVIYEKGLLDCDNLIKATNIALRARGFDGWAALPSDQANVDTTQSSKTIFIPRENKKSLENLDEVILGHEIDQHVACRENGDASGVLELSGTGAHGYLGPEEGRGKINEGLIKGKIVNGSSAFGFFLSGGLALGLDNDSCGRNFRETCELVWRINFLADYLSEKCDATDDSVRKSVTAATTHLMRIFRGTDGKYPGVIFPKDTVTYYQGGVDVMKKWDSVMDIDENARLFKQRVERSAKFDPNRTDHHRIVADNLRRNPYFVR